MAVLEKNCKGELAKGGYITKMKKKRSLWIMLITAICICVSMLFDSAVSVKADGEGQEYTYTDSAAFTCDAAGVITAYTGDRTVKELVVPQIVNGVTVAGIGVDVFKDMAELEFAAIPDTVTSIGDFAFSGCEKLNTIYPYQPVVDPATGVDTGKFVILNSEQNVRGVITLPANLGQLGTGAFADCTSIGKFAVADSNAYFTTYAWNRTSDPQSGNNSGEAAPVNPKNIGEILLSKDGTLMYRLAPAFHYTGNGLYNIPETVVTLLPYACEQVSLNGGFVIPASVKIIGDYAFYKCGNLNVIKFAEGSQTSVIGAYAFAYNDNLQKGDTTDNAPCFTLPASVTSIGTYSFAYCKNIVIDISQTQLQVIPDYAFYESDNLQGLETPVTLKKVGAYAFYGCNCLKEVKFLGKTLEEIGTGAFKTCNNLYIVDIPEGVTAIPDGTFDGCENLNIIKLPDSLKTIGDNAFKDCRNIHEMVIPPNVSHVSKNSFAGANQKNIDTSKNQYIQKFVKAELPAAGEKFTVGSLKYKITKSHATKGTVTLYGTKGKSLKTAKIPATIMYKGYKFKITSIGNNAFKNCKKLKTVKLGGNIKSIGKNAFYGCKKLTGVTLNAKLTTIGNVAFSKCTALKKITIPAKVTKIGSKAFYGDSKLKTITIKSSKIKTKKIGKSAFAKINKKATIKVPKKKLAAYKKIIRSAGAAKSVKIKK